MMPVLFGLILFSYLGSNIYIFIRGLQAISYMPSFIKWGLGFLYWLCAFVIVFVFLFREKEKADFWGHFIFQFGTGWLVFTLYMTFALLCVDFYRLFNRSFSHGFFISLVLVLGVLAYGFIRYQQPVNRSFNIVINKSLADSTTTSVKVVAVSDLHLGLGTPKARLRYLVNMINAEHPDLILISGDLIDNGIYPVQQAQMDEELRMLNAPLGIYMVPGNHEYISDIDECIRFMGRTSIHFLRDSTVTLPNGIQIIGRDDRSNLLRKPLSQLASHIDPNLPVIVLDHQPVDITQAEQVPADFLFCGHTHHGQIWPLTWITDRLFERSYGYEKRGQTHFYVSSGLSLWGPPFRIGTRSEMVVFNLSFREL